MRFNVQYVKNIILTALADIFDIDSRMKSQENISALHKGNIPHQIDTEVVKSGYFKLKSKNVELNDKALSLSDVQLFDVFDNNGMLINHKAEVASSISISKEILKVCQEKGFGEHSDIQTIALWAALKGIYTDVLQQVQLFNGSLGQELEAEMAKNPNSKYKSLHEFIQSIDLAVMNEATEYLSHTIKFANGPLSLQLTIHSLILLDQGWHNVARRPKKVIVTLPSEKHGANWFVSEKQLARILLLSSNDVTILNMETISLSDDNQTGINYFIPDMHGQVTLPPAFSNVSATSQLIGRVDRIHVYQVHFSTNKNLKVIHFPMTSGSEPVLTKSEQQYLFNSTISADGAIFDQESLMICGGYGSQLLSNLADYHSEKAVRGIDALKYAAVLGQEKPSQWQDIPRLSRYAEQQPLQLVQDYRSTLIRETILLVIKQQTARITEANKSKIAPVLAHFQQLLERIEQYDYPTPKELKLKGVSTYTDLARYLFGCLLVKEDRALASPKIEWLISLIIKPIDGITKGVLLDKADFRRMLVGQSSLIKANLQVLALKCHDEQLNLQFTVQKLLKLSRELKRLIIRKTAASEDSVQVYNVQKLIAAFLLELELKVLETQDLAMLNQFQQIKQFCDISEYLHLFSSEKHIKPIIEDYCSLEKMISSWQIVHGMILENDNEWRSEYKKLCFSTISVVSRKPQALVAFTEVFNKIIRNNFENETQRLTCLKQADGKIRKSTHELSNTLNEIILKELRLKQREIQQYSDMTSRDWAVENQTTRAIIHAPKLAIDKKVLVDAAAIAEKWVAEKNVESAEQQARIAAENRSVETQYIGSSSYSFGPFKADSGVMQNIRINTPNVIFLHISTLIELPMGTLHSPVLIDWLKITKKANAAIILISDQARQEEEYNKIANYFFKHHINVVDYFDLSQMTVESLKETINNINKKYQVNEPSDSLLIDIYRENTNEVIECLSTLIRRREITFDKHIPADRAQLIFFQALSYELNYFRPYISFFKNEINILPLMPLFFHRTSEFIETALVRDVPIADFSSRVEEFYLQKMRRGGGDRLAREPRPPAESINAMLFSYIQHREQQTGVSYDESVDDFYSRLNIVLKASFNDCKHLTSFERNSLFDKLREAYQESTFCNPQEQEVSLDRVFKELISASLLACYKGYRAGKYGIMEQKSLDLLFDGLAFILEVRYELCNKLTTFQKNVVFDKLLEQHALASFKEVTESNAWLLKNFDKLMTDLVTEKSRFANWLIINVRAKTQKAVQDFILAVFSQSSWLQEHNPELLADNVAYLSHYFDALCLDIRNSILQRDNLNEDDQTMLYSQIISVRELLLPYMRKCATPDNLEKFRGYYQELGFYLAVFFSRKNDKKIASPSEILKVLLSQRNNPITFVHVVHTKDILSELSNTIVINHLIGQHRILITCLIKELKKDVAKKVDVGYFKQRIASLRKELVQYNNLLNRFSFDGFIQQLDNAMVMLSDDFPNHKNILLNFNKDIWEHESQIVIANFLHSQLETELYELERPLSSPLSKEVIRACRNNIDDFESDLGLFNLKFGLSFYEFRIQQVKIRLLKMLPENNTSNEVEVTSFTDEDAKDCITILRSLTPYLIELKVSNVFRDVFQSGTVASSIARAQSRFETFFRSKCLSDISYRATKYFSKTFPELENFEAQQSIESLLKLIVKGINDELSRDSKLKNASNIAFLLDDLIKLNNIEKSITGKGFVCADKLNRFHNEVSKHVLKQRLCFLSDPTIKSCILGSGVRYVWSSMWNSASKLIANQRNDLKHFLENETVETNFSLKREQLLANTSEVMNALSADAQKLYGRILDETEIDDESIDDLSMHNAENMAISL